MFEVVIDINVGVAGTTSLHSYMHRDSTNKNTEMYMVQDKHKTISYHNIYIYRLY